jgi:hypothetical protein
VAKKYDDAGNPKDDIHDDGKNVHGCSYILEKVFREDLKHF